MAVAELCPHYVCVACATIMAHVPPYIISERAKRASSVMFVFNCDFRYLRIYIYVYMYVVVRQVMYAHARWYVLWEGLNVNHFLKHSNHFK